jgi:hypothetical protein
VEEKMMAFKLPPQIAEAHKFRLASATLQQRRLAQLLQSLAGVGLAGDYDPAPLYLKQAFALTESNLVAGELKRLLDLS